MTQFKKGQSGNIQGRPKGSKNKNTIIEQALSDYSEENNVDAKKSILDSLIGEAMTGDYNSIKLILERLSPSLKPVSQAINLDVRLPKDPVKRAEKIIDLTIQGELLIDEAKVLLEGMKSVLQIKEFAEIEKRIEELENAQTK